MPTYVDNCFSVSILQPPWNTDLVQPIVVINICQLKFQNYFSSRVSSTKLLTPDITLILFTCWTLPNFNWQLLGTDTNPWDLWSCLTSKCNRHNKYTYHHHLPNNWTGTNSFMTGCLCCHFSSQKFPGGPIKFKQISSISKSRRHPN